MTARTSERVGMLDEIRGFAIVCMVVYHLMFDLSYFYEIKVPIFMDGWFGIVRDFFAGTFIFISGIACRYSQNNLKRGVQCFFLGMVMTFVTAFVTPEAPVYFGILHLLGVCMMIYGLCEKFVDCVPPSAAITACAVLFSVTHGVAQRYLGFTKSISLRIPDEIYSAELLFPFGFIKYGFASVDFFPLLPWFFVFAAGAYTGVYIRQKKFPTWFYNCHEPFFGFAGRHSLWIYLLHQPVLALVLTAVTGQGLF